MNGFYYISENSVKYLIQEDGSKFLFEVDNCPVKPKVSKYVHDFYILKDKNGYPILLKNDNMGLEDFKNILKRFDIIMTLDFKDIKRMYNSRVGK